MWLLVLFIAVPMIEIALFIQAGSAIGLWPTLLIVVITAVLGTWLVRSQGILALSQLQSSLSKLNDPTESLVHGAMILFSGALLLTPGFFTDAMGFALLIPSVRSAVFRSLKSRLKIHSFSTPGSHKPNHPSGDIIEGEFTEINETPRDPYAPPSGWTKH